MKMTITEFCRKHQTWDEGRKWTLEHFNDMDEVWLASEPEDIILVATREGVLTEKELSLFAIWCARHVQHLMKDVRSVTLLDVAERYVFGIATFEELKAARKAACQVISEKKKWYKKAVPIYSRYAARSAIWAANSVARGGYYEATWRAAWGAAWDAALAWLGVGASGAAWDSARAAQAQYLRQNCKPNFEL